MLSFSCPLFNVFICLSLLSGESTSLPRFFLFVSVWHLTDESQVFWLHAYGRTSELQELVNERIYNQDTIPMCKNGYHNNVDFVMHRLKDGFWC